jgi:rhodanese-related sulfurtransferase
MIHMGFATYQSEGEEMNQSSSEFAETISDRPLQLLDVRTPEEFGAGYISGAINIDVNSEDFDSRIMALNKDLAYGIYCRSGIRSVTAMNRMSELGFHKMYHLTNGIIDWIATGHPVVTE